MVYEDRTPDPIEQKALATMGKLHTVDDIDVGILQTIPYEYPHRKISVTMKTTEFSCVCPFSGLPDFAAITIVYTPRKKLVEMKSLKYYLIAFRAVKIYNEHAINKLLEDLSKLLRPHVLEITGEFTSRGGISNTVTASYTAGA